MFRIPTRLILPLALGCAALACAPPAASASHTQTTYFEGGNVLLNGAKLPRALAQMQSRGVNALRIELYWQFVAPGANSATRPAFDATNPSSYSWGIYDLLISEAQRRHWKVLLTVTAPVPRWATSNHKAPYVTRPDAKAFEEFMTAVGRHYGSQVSLFSIWNEPNHPAFLQPQWDSRGHALSPRIYRSLYQAGYAGLQAGGVASPKVLFGETAPTGFDSVNPRREGRRALLHDVAPLAFMRGALCLDAHYRKSSTCTALPMVGYAHHAYTTAAGPLYRPPERDNVTIGVLSRLSRALDLAARAHALPAHVPIYLTEFGVQSKPNRFLGVPVGQQAEYDAIAEQIAWSNPRVAAFSQYLLVDDPLGGRPGASVNGGTIGFQTGLEYINGKPKPLYYAFPLPLVVAKRGHSFSLWGYVRPAGERTSVTVMVQLRGSHAYRKLKTVTTNDQGYWAFSSATRGARWRVRWRSLTGAAYEGPPIGAH